MFSELALGACSDLEFGSVLDIGSGSGSHAAHFRDLSKTVTTVNLEPPADMVGDYLELELPQHDLVWASHVLEHQPNPNLFLRKCFADTGRYFCVTVPPLKHEIVGGHLTLWNAGLLLYNMVIAGWDCSEAKVMTYGYNISVLVEKKKADLPPLKMDSGDIERLSGFFPFPVWQGFDGRTTERT
ncbi:MAG: class I SAM-dependent methyltransferase [Bacteroidales bacterium]|nr:class I SAM-dependent methyltransferase [Candidatus Latescibacterota bacterium]